MSKGIDKFQIISVSVGSPGKQIIIMEPGGFRKLKVHLPRQRLVNQRPWWIAGLLLAIAILFFAAWSYFAHKKHTIFPERNKQTAVQIFVW